MIRFFNISWRSRLISIARSDDHAKSKHKEKRGGGAQKVELDDAAIVSGGRAAEFIALDEALSGLALVDERKSKVVELRYFGGLSIEETAAVLGGVDGDH